MKLAFDIPGSSYSSVMFPEDAQASNPVEDQTHHPTPLGTTPRTI